MLARDYQTRSRERRGQLSRRRFLVRAAQVLLGLATFSQLPAAVAQLVPILQQRLPSHKADQYQFSWREIRRLKVLLGQGKVRYVRDSARTWQYILQAGIKAQDEEALRLSIACMELLRDAGVEEEEGIAFDILDTLAMDIDDFYRRRAKYLRYAKSLLAHANLHRICGGKSHYKTAKIWVIVIFDTAGEVRNKHNARAACTCKSRVSAG